MRMLVLTYAYVPERCELSAYALAMPCLVLTYATICLRTCYALSGTDLRVRCYGPTHLLRAVRY
eukprot:295092-Rhodomonas_salina.2